MVPSYKRFHQAFGKTPSGTPMALHEAANSNDADTVTALLQGGGANPHARVECPDFDEGVTALHLAARKGNLEATLALLNGGARPDGRNVAGPSRQHATSDAVGAVRSFDEWDISDTSDSDVSEFPGGWDGDLTPLHLACAGGHTEVVRALLYAGERTDRVASARRIGGLDHFGAVGIDVAPPFVVEGERDGGHTPLHLASASGAVGAVRALVEAGACVHCRAGDCDDTPLHLASAAGHVETISALLESGADINAGDEIGNTPLHVARDARTLEFLLARGANPNLVAMSRYGNGTPLASLCTLVHRLETDEKGMLNATAKVEALLRYGANVDIRATASCADRDVDLDELVSPVSSPATVIAASPVLSCAAKNGVPGIVSALLRAGLSPNERDRDGWAPIHDAAKSNHVEVLRLLLRAGADRDAPTYRGKWTPLHLACWYTSVECVVELLKWGAAMGPTARPISAMDGCSASLGREHQSKPYCDGAQKNAFVVEEQDGEEEEEEQNDADDKENGYGKTPAEVIGLKHLARAANSLANNGGDGLSADPSLDEEEEQMVVLGDDDEETRERVAGVGQRNAIRRALRRETAWRRRRSVVLLKVFVEKQHRPETSMVTTVTPPLPEWNSVFGSNNGSDDDSGTGLGVATDGSARTGEGRMRNTTTGSAAKCMKSAAATVPNCAGCRDGMWPLRGALEGLISLSGREEALFRQIVGFL